MIAELFENLKGKIPMRTYEFIFEDKEFSCLEEVLQFCSIYFFISFYLDQFNRNNSFKTFSNQSDLLSLKEFASMNPDTSDLADWVQTKLWRRVPETLENKFSYLYKTGLRKQDILDIFVNQAFYRFYMLSGLDWNQRRPSTSQTIQELKKSFKTSFSREIEKKDKKPIKLLFFSVIPEVLETLVSVLENRTQEMNFENIMSCIRGNLREIDIETFDFGHYASVFRKEPFHYQPTREVPSLFSRIQMQGNRLKLCFIRKYGPVWYTVNAKTGIITFRQNGKTIKSRYHFALKRLGSSHSKICRGKNDILLKFMENAWRNLSISENEFLNRYCLKLRFREELDTISQRFLKKIDKKRLFLTKKMSRRYAIQWEIYSIYCAYSEQSVEIFRLERFSSTFPSLLQIVYPGFLKKYVITGKPIKKILPYWSPFFRQEAEKTPKNYQESRHRFMKAISYSLGATKDADQEEFNCFLDLIGFRSPFTRVPLFKEKYLVWMQNNSHSTREDLHSFYDFIRNKEYVVSDKTTCKSLQRRHDEWIKELNASEAHIEQKKFPEPWFDLAWNSGKFSIVPVSSPFHLMVLGRDQKNCVYSYCARIRRGEVQIYALKEHSRYIATIEVKNNSKKPELGQCLGKMNTRLDNDHMNVIREWFTTNVGEKEYPVS